MLNLQAKEARVIKENKEIMLPLDKVKVGDTLLIKPGEKIPVDGKVTKGDTSIDESMLTGSLYLLKSSGDSVIGLYHE